MRYIITDTSGTPFNTFHFGDMEYSEIFHFSRDIYTVYKTKKEAKEQIKWIREMAEKQRERWGDLLTEQILNFTKTMFINKINS